MEVTEDNAHWFADSFTRITDNVGKALLGKEDVIRLALTCMFAEGHLLLEDAPGTGKTALARRHPPPPCTGRIRASSSRPTCCPPTSRA